MIKTKLTFIDKLFKRSFDIVISLIGILITTPIIVLALIISWIETKRFGFFTQTRVGRNRKLFKILKIRTMIDIPEINTTVTVLNDRRITKAGAVIRKLKIDELPQLFNVLFGQMSLVGPRPDVPEFIELIPIEDEIVLSLRPGITGPATLKYKNEELLLSLQTDPEKYNQEIIFPDKVRINKKYLNEYKFRHDVKYIIYTFINGKSD